jgi:hypothetical protein
MANPFHRSGVPLDAARLVAARQVLPANDRSAVVAEAGQLLGRGGLGDYFEEAISFPRRLRGRADAAAPPQYQGGAAAH